MHDGVPSYGVRVNPDKTLTNFEVTINNKKINRLVGSKSFPYCGSFVDTKTLDITKDRERRKDVGMLAHNLWNIFRAFSLTRETKAIADSMTVEFSKVPGKTFHRKILSESLRFSFFRFVPCNEAEFPTLPQQGCDKLDGKV